MLFSSLESSFQGFHMLDDHQKSPHSRGKPAAGNAVAPAWLSAAQGCDLVKSSPVLELHGQRSTPGFSTCPVSTSPPRRTSKGLEKSPGQSCCGYWENQAIISLLPLPNLQCHTGSTGVSPSDQLCQPTLPAAAWVSPDHSAGHKQEN